MRLLLHIITTALSIAAASSLAFAQGASIQVEQPWSRATPAGASTGAAYLTINNKSHDADRLLGASSDVLINCKFTRSENFYHRAHPGDGSGT
jgi:copper(I)-binding protein